MTFIVVVLYRIQKATESLKTFQPLATPSFDEFVLDTSKEEILLKELSFGGGKNEDQHFHPASLC